MAKKKRATTGAKRSSGRGAKGKASRGRQAPDKSAGKSRAAAKKDQGADAPRSPTGRGRPKGAANKNYEHATAEPTRCKKCGSTERSPYFGVYTQAFAGVRDGQPYTHIVRRKTFCRNPDCGQLRIDTAYENRAA